MCVCACLLNLTNTRYYFCHCVEILKKNFENFFEKNFIFEVVGVTKGKTFQNFLFCSEYFNSQKKAKKKDIRKFSTGRMDGRTDGQTN